jgi:hypothetical protein
MEGALQCQYNEILPVFKHDKVLKSRVTEPIFMHTFWFFTCNTPLQWWFVCQKHSVYFCFALVFDIFWTLAPLDLWDSHLVFKETAIGGVLKYIPIFVVLIRLEKFYSFPGFFRRFVQIYLQHSK